MSQVHVFLLAQMKGIDINETSPQTLQLIEGTAAFLSFFIQSL